MIHFTDPTNIILRWSPRKKSRTNFRAPSPEWIKWMAIQNLGSKLIQLFLTIKWSAKGQFSISQESARIIILKYGLNSLFCLSRSFPSWRARRSNESSLTVCPTQNMHCHFIRCLGGVHKTAPQTPTCKYLFETRVLSFSWLPLEGTPQTKPLLQSQTRP